MGKDIAWKAYFSDNGRYADLVNGIGCSGRQVIGAEDLQEQDSQEKLPYGKEYAAEPSGTTGQKVKIRDIVRKAAFGVNFLIVGIESQEEIDYAIPLRIMSYDVGKYEKQAAKIRKEVRKNPQGLKAGEYLYGFRKNSRLCPVVTFILYSGTDTWDAPKSLHEMLNFTDIPETLRDMVADYKIHLIEIRKLKDTSVFRTDVRQVFDFIRCSEDKDALARLVENDEYYQNMEEDAFDVVSYYTNATELIETKDYYRKDGKLNMCKALKELIADGREEGREEGIKEGREEGREEGKIEGVILMCRELDFSEDIILKKLQKLFFLSKKEAKEYVERL